MSELLTAQVFREASEAIAVLTPTYDEVVAVERRRRRGARRRVLAAVAALAVVVGGTTWLTTRAEPPEHRHRRPTSTVVRQDPNPVGVPWYANGELHLANVVVQVDQPASLFALNGGAVYADQRGRVAFVAADGVRRPLGRSVPGTPLAVSAGENWAAWLSPGDPEPGAFLVVHDVAVDRMVGVRHVPDDTALVAIDQRRVFYSSGAPGGTAYGWSPEGDDVEQVARPGLADVESATRVYARGGRVLAVQPFFSVSHRWRGSAPMLSPGGSVVLAAGPGDAPGRPFRPRLFDTRSGERLPSGLDTDEVAVDVTFSGSGMLTYLVTRAADLAGGSDLDGNNDPLLVLRVCQVGIAECTDRAPVPSGSDQPMLAH